MSYRIIVISLIIFIAGCDYLKGNNASQPIFEVEKSYNRMYYVTDSALNKLPYLNYKSVIFKDSIGNSLKFEIKIGETTTEEQLDAKKDWEEMTMVLYHVFCERKKIFLVSEDYEFDFLFEFYPEPNKAYLETGEIVRDEIEMFALSNKKYSNKGGYEKYHKDLIFQDIVDVRSWKSKQYSNQPSPLFDKIEIRGKSFQNFLDYPSIDTAPYMVLFNYEVGIISFQDDSGTTWLFNSFE